VVNSPATIDRLTGVYHADGGLRGELAYVVGKIRGTTHCALCDITHRGVRHKREWVEMLAALDVPVELVHLNERSDQVEAASAGQTPCVLAHVDDRIVTLLGPEDLERIGGDVDAFVVTLRAAAQAVGLRWKKEPDLADC
jgi:hypothetical protein